MNEVIEEIYRTGVVRDDRGTDHALSSSVSRTEGEFLHDLIASDPTVVKTLEVGCAYGLSSLFICSALSGRSSSRHLIVDPDQHTSWHGIGVANLRRAGFDRFELIEQPSELALPEIARTRSGAFDLIFIDGWHTFDHTLLDLFFANLLVRVEGWIVVDDCTWPPVAKAVSYVSRYPAYRLVAQCPPKRTVTARLARIVGTVVPPWVARNALPLGLYDRFYVRTLYSSMVALKKVAEDERRWDWFVPF